MLAKTNCEKATTKKFRAKLKPYHHHFSRCSKAVAVHNGRSQDKVRLGDLVTIPDSDLHHVMEYEAMLAISHAIEDLVHIGNDILAVDFNDLVFGGAQGDVKNGTALSEVDLIAAKHGIDACAQAGFLRQLEKQGNGFISQSVF